jgi:hypothetical protein
VECLEDRCLPSILFGDTPGLTTSDNGGPVLSNAQLRLVFWGSGWLTNGTLETQMQNAVDSLNSSTYFYSPFPGADLSQYRPGTAAAPTRVGSFLVSPFAGNPYPDPPASFATSDVINMLQAEFGMTPNYYYYVVPQPGSIPSASGTAALHTFWSQGGNNEYFGYTRDLATPSLDDLTVLYAHEMAESITDPDGTALQVNPRNPSAWNEICDGEAQNYSYRLNGVLVQPYWSQADGKFTVPTGQVQNFYVSSSGVLTVNGDQLGANYNDTITLDVSGAGGVLVTLNGETAQFEPGAISSVVVNTGGGTDTVNVLRTIVPVNLNYLSGAGADEANIGTGGSVQAIQSPVTVFNSGSYTHVNVDDSSDLGNHGNVTISANGVTGLAPGAINFTSFSVNTLTVKGGSSKNTYTITGTPVITSMTLDAGSNALASDKVYVQSVSVPLTINGGTGIDTIAIGSLAPNLMGTLAGITAPLTITSTSVFSIVTVDDSGDSTAQSGAVSGASITGLGLGGTAAINYIGSQLASLAIHESTGGATVAVTGSSTATTLWDNGPGTVNIGSGGSLAGILGSVTVENEPNFDTVNINDQNDTVFRTATLSTVNVKGSTLGRFGGLIPIAPISWDYADTTQVNINTGQAGITLTVLGTGVPTFLNGNSLGTNTLAGGNVETTWNVTGANQGNFSNSNASATFTNFQNLTGGSDNDGFVFSNGATLSGTLNGGGGGNGISMAAYTTNLTVNITSGDAGNVPGVLGSFLNISGVSTGSGNDSFVFSNAASITSIDGGSGTNTLNASAYTSSRTVFVDGLNQGMVSGVVFEFAEIQNVTAGSGNDTFVFDSGASLVGTIDGGFGVNTLDALPGTAGLTFSIKSTNGGSAAGLVGTFAHIQNLLGAGAGSNVFGLSPGGSISGGLDGGFGGNNWLDYNAWKTPMSVNLATGTATAVTGGISNIQNVRGGQGGDTLIGDSLGNILIGGAGADVIQGGSGRSILIGGAGADQVTGGSADDIVIGGTVTYSNQGNFAALEAILAEWQSADSYLTRINKIKNVGVGPMNQYKLVWGSTVLDDAAPDILTGGAGTDWFFAKLANGVLDTITDLAAGEHVD